MERLYPKFPHQEGKQTKKYNESWIKKQYAKLQNWSSCQTKYIYEKQLTKTSKEVQEKRSTLLGL